MDGANLTMAAGLDRLTLAIGEDRFGDQLFDTVRVLANADHVLAFAYFDHQPPRVVINSGTFALEAMAHAVSAFAGSLYLLDPNYAEIRRAGDGECLWFPVNKARRGDHYQEAFFDLCGISDVVAFATRHKDVVFCILVLRGGGQTFADGQRWLLAQLRQVVAANVHKHFSYMYAVKGQNQFVIDRVLAEAPTFAALTPRERRVCLGILTGYTSESIGINLEISVNSVLTYRKRLYEKLDISSQNELFMKVINAMMDLSRPDTAVLNGKKSTLRPLEPARSARDDRFNEFYMAEAFISDDMI